MRLSKGFTLIELLVVIAIIAILAAILFPVFATAREKARQTTCLSNEKQIGLGVMQYAQDYDELYPTGAVYAVNGGQGRGWAGQVYPYVKSTGAFYCLNDRFQKPGYYVSYALNNNFTNTTSPIQISQAVAPAKTVYIFEVDNNYQTTSTLDGSQSSNGCSNGTNSFSGGVTYIATGQMKYDDLPLPTSVMKYADGRHNGGSCFIMADGHVKFFMPKMVSCGYENDLTAANNPAGTMCGGKKASTSIIAAATSCTDSTIAATFTVKN
ncbi:MAG TPA: DUF1559 domain-containing protein [Capsulimonadaceae bacterium]|jgi:prepilin-type N-terminal cleavage/methylation domain-containing protein/prepilin-type processing-associated H-X9-DG protein